MSTTAVNAPGSTITSLDYAGPVQAFLENNDIKHITSAPYYPASNGLAVQIERNQLKQKEQQDSKLWERKLNAGDTVLRTTILVTNGYLV